MTTNPDDRIIDVEIIEPPIQELKKRGPWLTTACMSGCGFILIFVVGIIIGIKIFIGSGPREIKNLPPNFPAGIPIYDEYNIDKITHITGRYKSRSMEVSALFPKLILSPLILNNDAGQSGENRRPGIIRELWRTFTEPVGDTRDTVQIEWRDISGDAKTMMAYYKNNLIDANCSIESETAGLTFTQLTFTRGDGLSGTIYVEPGEEKKIISYAYLIINLPPSNAVTTTSNSSSPAQ
ncbi:MAG: hypothetical protein NTW66_03200 [Candidatus Magasanikbacteria bacterium]|nr:hypothetical protein [Candidatus Magasanikbacteria bacterium]